MEQRQELSVFQSAARLTVHNLQERDVMEIQAAAYPKSLSEADKSVLHIANKIDACVVSSDKAVRNCAKNRAIEYHGILWVLDKMTETSVLSKKEAAHKLKLLIDKNPFLGITNN